MSKDLLTTQSAGQEAVGRCVVGKVVLVFVAVLDEEKD